MKYDPDRGLAIVEFAHQKLREIGGEGMICIVANNGNHHRMLKRVCPTDILEALDSLSSAASNFLPNFMVSDFLKHLAMKYEGKEDDAVKMKEKVAGAISVIGSLMGKED